MYDMMRMFGWCVEAHLEPAIHALKRGSERVQLRKRPRNTTQRLRSVVFSVGTFLKSLKGAVKIFKNVLKNLHEMFRTSIFLTLIQMEV